MSGYFVSGEAERDLHELWEYIAADNVDAADRLIVRLKDAFEELARHPSIGHRRDDVTNYAVLFWAVGSYLVVYRAEHSPIEIVAIVHGARDIPTFPLGRGTG
jgi:plasmid stabilization system protein ParE